MTVRHLGICSLLAWIPALQAQTPVPQLSFDRIELSHADTLTSPLVRLTVQGNGVARLEDAGQAHTMTLGTQELSRLESRVRAARLGTIPSPLIHPGGIAPGVTLHQLTIDHGAPPYFGSLSFDRAVLSEPGQEALERLVVDLEEIAHRVSASQPQPVVVEGRLHRVQGALRIAAQGGDYRIEPAGEASRLGTLAHQVVRLSGTIQADVLTVTSIHDPFLQVVSGQVRDLGGGVLGIRVAGAAPGQSHDVACTGPLMWALRQKRDQRLAVEAWVFQGPPGGGFASFHVIGIQGRLRQDLSTSAGAFPGGTEVTIRSTRPAFAGPQARVELPGSARAWVRFAGIDTAPPAATHASAGSSATPGLSGAVSPH